VRFGPEVRAGIPWPVVECVYDPSIAIEDLGAWAGRLASEDVRWWVLAGTRRDDQRIGMLSLNAQLSTPGLSLAWRTPLFACSFEAEAASVANLFGLFARRGSMDLRLRVGAFYRSLQVPFDFGPSTWTIVRPRGRNGDRLASASPLW